MALGFVADFDSIKIDDVSSDELGLYFDYLEVPPMPHQRRTKWSTKRDEDGFSADDTYENVTWPFSCYSFFDANYYNSAVYAYFANAKKLELSRLPGYHYRVVDIQLAAPEQVLGGKRIAYKGVFELSPFKYANTNTPITVTNNQTVEYSGTRYGKPIISGVSGASQELIITSTHGTTQDRLSIRNCTAGETIYIDTERKIVHDGTNILFNRVDGAYPTLQPGDNAIAWEGTFNNVQIIRNRRSY